MITEVLLHAPGYWTYAFIEALRRDITNFLNGNLDKVRFTKWNTVTDRLPKYLADLAKAAGGLERLWPWYNQYRKETASSWSMDEISKYLQSDHVVLKSSSSSGARDIDDRSG